VAVEVFSRAVPDQIDAEIRRPLVHRSGDRALIDPAAVGRGLRVFAGVRLVRHARADVVAFERAVVRLPEVVHTHHVTGNYDYLLQVEVADLPAYEDFHANRLASLPGVAMVTS